MPKSIMMSKKILYKIQDEHEHEAEAL